MCKKCVTYLVCCLQMSRISCDLLMCCANGAEFALFAVFFLEFTGFTSRFLEQLVADSANFASFARAVGKLRKIWLIHSNFLGFSVDGQRSEISELDVDECLVQILCNSWDLWAN